MSSEAKELKQRNLKKYSKYSARVYNRCRLCGRARGYMRPYDMCRICFRKLAHKGEIPGVVKSSW